MTYLQFTNHDPAHWRRLAQQKREMALRMKTVVARSSLINAAEYYDELAQRATRFVDDASEGPQELYAALADKPVSLDLQPASEQSLEIVIHRIKQGASTGQSARDKVPGTTASRPQRGPIFSIGVFLAGCAVAGLLAIGCYYSLSLIQQPVSEAFSTDAVRLN